MCKTRRWSVWFWIDGKRSTFEEDCVKNDFYIFVPSDLDLRSLNLKFALIVTVVHRYVFTELQVSMTFVFRENRSYGTDGHTGATLNAFPREEDHIINLTNACRFNIWRSCITFNFCGWLAELYHFRQISVHLRNLVTTGHNSKFSTTY